MCLCVYCISTHVFVLLVLSKQRQIGDLFVTLNKVHSSPAMPSPVISGCSKANSLVVPFCSSVASLRVAGCYTRA